jgi:hypothetical protein
MASFCIHQEWNESQKSLFYLFSYFFGSVWIFMHPRHIFLCGTKVTFLCGKSPNDSGKSHLEIAAFFHFHCNCFITFYICFFTSFTTGTVTLGIYSMWLYPFLEGTCSRPRWEFCDNLPIDSMYKLSRYI